MFYSYWLQNYSKNVMEWGKNAPKGGEKCVKPSFSGLFTYQCR